MKKVIRLVFRENVGDTAYMVCPKVIVIDIDLPHYAEDIDGLDLIGYRVLYDFKEREEK